MLSPEILLSLLVPRPQNGDDLPAVSASTTGVTLTGIRRLVASVDDVATASSNWDSHTVLALHTFPSQAPTLGRRYRNCSTCMTVLFMVGYRQKKWRLFSLPGVCGWEPPFRSLDTKQHTAQRAVLGSRDYEPKGRGLVCPIFQRTPSIGPTTTSSGGGGGAGQVA